MNEFVEECRREWRRLGVPDPIANEMAADLTADIEEAESEGGTAEDVVGNGAFDPRRFAGSWAMARGVTAPPAISPPPRRWPVLAFGLVASMALLALGAAIAVGGRQSAAAISSASRSGRAQIGPCGPWFSHSAAALPASTGRRDRGPPLAGRWRGRRRSRRSVPGPLERHPHRALGDPQTPSSLWDPQGMTDLPASVHRNVSGPSRRRTDRAACDTIESVELDRAQPACRSLKVSVRRLPRGRRARLRSPKVQCHVVDDVARRDQVDESGGGVFKHGERQFLYPLCHSASDPTALVVAGLW